MSTPKNASFFLRLLCLANGLVCLGGPRVEASASTPSTRAADIAVAFDGKVVDGLGQGIANASVSLLDAPLAAVKTDAQGNFTLSGSFANGVLRRADLPGGVSLRMSGGRLRIANPGHVRISVTLISPSGRVREVMAGGPGENASTLDLDSRLGAAAGLYWLRVQTPLGQSTYRYLISGGGRPGALLGPFAFNRSDATDATRKLARTAADSGRFILAVSAAGFLDKRFLQTQLQQSRLVLALLPASATLKQRVEDFLGAGNTFRLAFLKKDSTGKPVLRYVDFAEMAADTMPVHTFADSHSDIASVEAFAPSWSPDGRVIAYEMGRENLTTPYSRVYLQPLSGARMDGPAHPATNPRWWTDGKDTALIWCSSGAAYGWLDTASATYKQVFSGGQLTGQKIQLTQGSYNAGLSTDGRYLATGFPFGVMLDMQGPERRYFHIYPGHPRAKDGGNTDSLQVCNASISRDAAFPARMLFLDFGVPDGDSAYPNPVMPQHYALHRMILIGDYLSAAPGRIVDFIDSPAQELARNRTWDDPEWSNLPDFAVATTRDPVGPDPLNPVTTQPDIYLIKLGTKESLKVFGGVNQTLPVVWIGPKN